MVQEATSEAVLVCVVLASGCEGLKEASPRAWPEEQQRQRARQEERQRCQRYVHGH